jgi:hypothetical protein
MPKKRALLEELENRWRLIFSRLVDGGEVPPTLRLRAEGLMEALVLLELATEEELQFAMAACYADYYSAALPVDWRELFPFPQIPGHGLRAPVYPSTRE